jgi:CTP synthase (UTP-ammonia lyase)
MSHALKIAIIGDYNFTYYSHQATNLSLDHSGLFLEVDVSYYWLKLNEAVMMKSSRFEQYDGVWIAPGPVSNPFFLHGIIKTLNQLKIPTLLTGESFKSFIEVLINNDQLNSGKEKLISDNLVEGNSFEKITIIPHSKSFIKLLENHTTFELSSSRYSIYPQAIQQLAEESIDIEAYNQFEDPEIVSLKNHPFFVACGYCPQISSTRELPHPLVYTFIKACMAVSEKSADKLY